MIVQDDALQPDRRFAVDPERRSMIQLETGIEFSLTAYWGWSIRNIPEEFWEWVPEM
jgi:hypothetical protein